MRILSIPSNDDLKQNARGFCTKKKRQCATCVAHILEEREDCLPRSTKDFDRNKNNTKQIIIACAHFYVYGEWKIAEIHKIFNVQYEVQ